MAEEELIDSIVSNESLGIKKKPSVFKILAVGGIVAVFVSLAYSFYTGHKNTAEQPPLELNSDGLSGFNSESNAISNLEQLNELAQGTEDANPVEMSSAETPPTQNTQLAPLAEAIEQNKSNQDLTDTAEQPSKLTDKAAPTEDKALALTTNEMLVEEPPIKKTVAKKPVVKKWTKKKVSKPQAKPLEVTTAPTLIEEGVTQEEIIVFQ